MVKKQSDKQVRRLAERSTCIEVRGQEREDIKLFKINKQRPYSGFLFFSIEGSGCIYIYVVKDILCEPSI